MLSSKTLLVAAAGSSLFWLLSQWVSPYANAFTGAIFELLSLPMLLILFGIPIIIIALAFLKRRSITRLDIVTLFISVVTIAILTIVKA